MTNCETASHGETAWEFYRTVLGNPRVICAPMVRGSGLEFREVVRKHGVDLCYSPMIEVEPYLARKNGYDTWFDVADFEKRTGIVAQVAGQDPDLLLKAAKEMEPRVSAIDLNLGCPQKCAEDRGFGAFLTVDEESRNKVAETIVKTLVRELSVPVFCKIRVLETPQKTLAFAKQLRDAGVYLIAVHGRERHVKHDGPVQYEQIKLLAQELDIPIVANGGIANLDDVERVMKECGVAGVMVASALLKDPRAFQVTCVTDTRDMKYAIDVAYEYLEMALKHPVPHYRYHQVHMRWIFRHHLNPPTMDENGYDQNGRHVRRWFSLLNQPYMQSAWQYLCFLRLMAIDFKLPAPDLEYFQKPILDTFKKLRRNEPEVLNTM